MSHRLGSQIYFAAANPGFVTNLEVAEKTSHGNLVKERSEAVIVGLSVTLLIL